jgi:hypothetical protein
MTAHYLGKLSICHISPFHLSSASIQPGIRLVWFESAGARKASYHLDEIVSTAGCKVNRIPYINELLHG